MARKLVIPSYIALNAADATVSQTSGESIVDGTDKVSYHVTFSANNTGTFTVQAKNGNNDAWYDLDFGQPLTITADNEAVFFLNECPFTKVRLLWSPSAGSGTMTAILTSKSLGA
jgi:hypothetical protein